MGIAMIVLIVLVAGLVVWAFVRTSRQQPTAAPLAQATSPASPPPRPDVAVEQARMRYAKGEIERDQFLRIVRDLSGESEPDLLGGGTEQPPATQPPPA
jgi:uncharacterized membrane protein